MDEEEINCNHCNNIVTENYCGTCATPNPKLSPNWLKSELLNDPSNDPKHQAHQKIINILNLEYSACSEDEIYKKLYEIVLPLKNSLSKAVVTVKFDDFTRILLGIGNLQQRKQNNTSSIIQMMNSSINTKFSSLTQEQKNQNQSISELTKQISILPSKVITSLPSSP